MKNYRILILAVNLFAIRAGAVETVTSTYHLEMTGDKKLQAMILSKLTSKPCFKASDVGAGDTTAECHAFVPFKKGSKVEGDKDFLLKIEVKASKGGKPGTYTVQGFKTEGKKLVSYSNPGKFTVPSEYQIQNGDKDFSEARFVKQAFSSIVELSFK